MYDGRYTEIKYDFCAFLKMLYGAILLFELIDQLDIYS